MKYRQMTSLCDGNPIDCCFSVKTYPTGTTVHNEDININYLIFCLAGHIQISSTFFNDEILCAGEVMFVPRKSEYSSIALNDVTLLVHKFNNTICQSEKCILAYLYSHQHIKSKICCSKLTIPKPLQILVTGIVSYLKEEIYDSDLWKLKHKELIWAFTRYYDAEELRSFFHPMLNEHIPLQNLVMTHYRKAYNTEELAKLCGYGIYTFRRIFKTEFGTPVYQWLIQKRAEHIKFRLSRSYIPFSDIIDEFNFSSAQHFNSFCKQYLGDTPGNLRKGMKSSPE